MENKEVIALIEQMRQKINDLEEKVEEMNRRIPLTEKQKWEKQDAQEKRVQFIRRLPKEEKTSYFYSLLPEPLKGYVMETLKSETDVRFFNYDGCPTWRLVGSEKPILKISYDQVQEKIYLKGPFSVGGKWEITEDTYYELKCFKEYGIIKIFGFVTCGFSSGNLKNFF